MSHENVRRNMAEQMYTEIKNNNPAWLVQALLHMLTIGQDHALRQMCAVILRRAVTKSGNLFSNLPPEVQTSVKQQLLQLVVPETQTPVRRSLAFCIAGLGSTLCEQGQWPELFPFLFNGVKDGDSGLKKSCLNIFSSLATYLEDSFFVPYLPVMRDAFQFAMAEQHDMEVRVGAIEAMSSMVSVLEEDQHVVLFRPAVSDVLKTIGQCLGGPLEDKATEAIESLVTIAESTPQLFTKSLAEVYQSMIQIASSEQVEESVRQIALEFCLTLAETDPRHTKKVPGIVDAFFPLSMKFLTTLEHGKDWGVTQDDDDSEITFYDVGLEALDRISLALGGKVIEPVATGMIMQYLQSPHWQYRHAGLMALSQCAEGCARQFEVNLASIVHMVLKHFEDQHERVRWSAVHCIAQLSNDFSPGLQATFHSSILPALMHMLTDGVPRIIAHTANAIVNFMDEAEAQFTAPYLDELVTKLLLVLQNSRLKFVNEEVLAAFASIAESCEQDFCKYYDHIVPYLKQLLAQPPTDKADRMLRAKAMECISLIGMSVGKDKFAADAKQVMEMLHSTLASKLEADDPQAQYILQGWARIAKCLGEEFSPYLPYVVPHILEQASIQTDVTVTDVDENDDGADDEEGVETLTLAIKGVGDKKIQIKTSLLQDKALACSILESLLEDIPKGMAQYVEQVSTIIVPLLKFPYLAEIRDTASKVFPLMIAALPAHLNKGDMLRHLIAHLLDAIKAESDVEVACSLVECYSRCLNACDANLLPDDMVARCADLLKKVFDESLQRRKNVSMKQKEVDDDEDEVEKLEAENEGEEELLSQVVEAVGATVKKNLSFVPAFATVFYPMCLDLLGDGYGDVEKRLALCAFDDFVEHGSQISAEAVQPYLQPIIAALLKFSNSQDPDLTQAAVYGLGVCAQYAANVFRQVVPQAVERLVAVCKNPQASDETYAMATANALSSIVKLMKYQHDHDSGLCRMENLMPIVLSNLPIQADEVEARYIHEQVVDWVLAGNPLVLGENRSNLPAIQELCKKLMDTELVNDATKEKMKAIIAG